MSILNCQFYVEAMSIEIYLALYLKQIDSSKDKEHLALEKALEMDFMR